MNIEIEENNLIKKIGKCKHIVTNTRSQSRATKQQAGTLISVYVTNERVGCLKLIRIGIILWA